jgi:hypothetical protein
MQRDGVAKRSSGGQLRAGPTPPWLDSDSTYRRAAGARGRRTVAIATAKGGVFMKTGIEVIVCTFRTAADGGRVLGRALVRVIGAGFAEPRCLPPRFGEGEGPGRYFGLLVSFDGRPRR